MASKEANASVPTLPPLEELARQLKERRTAEYAKVDKWFAGELHRLVDDIGVRRSRLAPALGVSRPTLDRWLRP